MPEATIRITSTMLRIATLNLNYLNEKHGTWDNRKRLIREEFARLQPDIIALQAVAKPPNATDQAEELASELDGFLWHFFQPAQVGPDDIAQGSGVISRVPMQEKLYTELSLIPNLEDANRRVLLKTIFALKDGPFQLVNAHFSWVPEQAAANAEEAAEYMNHSSYPSVLVGDLNVTEESDALAAFRNAGFVDAWKQAEKGAKGYTFESHDPSVRIDYVWLSPFLHNKLTHIELVASPPSNSTRLSDHLGLLCELDIVK